MEDIPKTTQLRHRSKCSSSLRCYSLGGMQCRLSSSIVATKILNVLTSGKVYLKEIVIEIVIEIIYIK